MKKTGDIIKVLREEKRISQEELASNIGCSSKSIYRYENHYSLIDTTTLINLALFFDVTTDYLLCLNITKKNIANADNKSIFADIIETSKLNKPYKNHTYYWIFKNERMIGGQYKWVGWTKDGKEKRELYEVIPEKAIERCTSAYGKPMIINTKDEAIAFSIVGGNAIISANICHKYLPEYLEMSI